MKIPKRIYSRVLVPLDGSETAEFAIRFAADLALKHEAELLLLYLADLPLVPGDTPPDEQDIEARQRIRRNLDALRDDLKDQGLHVKNDYIETQNLSSALKKYLETERVSAVVMSTEGRTNLLRWLFGAHADKALTAFPVPIMLVRPAYHKIVVPLDGSRWSESAIPRAVEIARVHNAEIILLHVYQSSGEEFSAQWALAGQQQIADQGYEQIREQLVALRNRLRQEGLNVREHIIRGGSPARTICEFAANEEGISMVVMSTHGRTGLSRWLVGSVAQKVMKNLRCPVTLVQPEKS